MTRLRLVAAILSLASLLSNAFADGAGIDSQPDYRAWQHVKSMIIQPGHPLEDPFAGIHHIYANPLAVTGLADGEYKSGAVFVFDLLNYEDKDKVIVETNRKRLDVMRYDPRRFAATAGWEYSTYLPNDTPGRLSQDVVTACFNCHMAAKTTGYVFSKYRP